MPGSAASRRHLRIKDAFAMAGAFLLIDLLRGGR
jgi:hypothetical protein